MVSGARIAPATRGTIVRILHEEGFSVNVAKTRFSSGRGRRIITGISVSSQVLKVPRNLKREVRKQAVYLVGGSLIEESTKNGVFDPIYLDRVIGRLTFWINVEPDAGFPRKAIEQLKEKYML